MRFWRGRPLSAVRMQIGFLLRVTICWFCSRDAEAPRFPSTWRWSGVFWLLGGGWRTHLPCEHHSQSSECLFDRSPAQLLLNQLHTKSVWLKQHYVKTLRVEIVTPPRKEPKENILKKLGKRCEQNMWIQLSVQSSLWRSGVIGTFQAATFELKWIK